MATKSEFQKQRREIDSFDVTCVIGTVHLNGPDGELPGIVAMDMIARHDAPGTYQFPMADGRTQIVTIEYRESQ